MKWHRIQTILLHSYYHFFRSKETLVDLIWFTFIQFIIFGFLSKILVGSNAAIGASLMLGLLFWETVRIGQYCLSVSILWEIWSKSLNSMFITPLTLQELITGEAIAGVIKTIGVIGSLMILCQLLFHFSVFQLGPILAVYFLLLLLFSYAAGLFVNGIIFRYGTDVQSMAWGMIFIFQPISAIYYPVSVLPVQVRWLAYISPITYVMESARGQLAGGNTNWSYLGISFLLDIVYLCLTAFFIKKMFSWSKKTGAFARLGN